jgi:hypothetical protein
LRAADQPNRRLRLQRGVRLASLRTGSSTRRIITLQRAHFAEGGCESGSPLLHTPSAVLLPTRDPPRTTLSEAAGSPPLSPAGVAPRRP